ncbi:MAG: hypothetical protein ACPGGK_16845, partial [Pikeienuella sp.]
MKPIIMTAVLSSALLASACASVTRGTTEEMSFDSNPQGAEMTTDLGPNCVTPCILEIDRKATFTATFTLDEETRTIFVDTEVAAEGVAAGAGNLLLGGVIGIGVDAATGANLNHTPNPVFADFDKSQEEQQPVEEEA